MRVKRQEDKMMIIQSSSGFSTLPATAAQRYISNVVHDSVFEMDKEVLFTHTFIAA